MKSIAWLVTGFALGIILTIAVVRTGGSAQLQAQRAYAQQIQRDLAAEQKATLNDVRARIEATAHPAGGVPAAKTLPPRPISTTDSQTTGTATTETASASSILKAIEEAEKDLDKLRYADRVNTSPKPQWQLDIDWAFSDDSTTNCLWEYLSRSIWQCGLWGGGRSCAMMMAQDLAKNNKIHETADIALVTQCHNSGAQDALRKAGDNEVWNYVRQH